MNKARIRIKGMAAQVYWPDTGETQRLAVVASGLPYAPDKEPITELLVQSGYMVLQPQYAGTYDSDGAFSPTAAISTLLNWQQLLQVESTLFDHRGHRWVTLPTDVGLLVAHSFGTYGAIGALLRGFNARAAMMFSPMFEFGTQSTSAGLRVDMEKHIRHIEGALPLTFRLTSPDEWIDFFLHTDSFHPFPDMLKEGRAIPLICVCGTNDPSIDCNRSMVYVRDFCTRYARRLRLLEYIRIPGAGHDWSALLSSDVCRALSSFL